MIQTLKYKLANTFRRDNQRSKGIIRNILMSFGVKGGSIAVGLILVPITINYISAVQYGIWLTISSIVSWMSFFDIGMGNGLRNKLATEMAMGRYIEARKYVSTTYAVLLLIAIGLFLIFWLVNPYIHWREFLNIPDAVQENITLAVFIVFSSFCVQFVVQLINTVLTALHEPAIAGLISFLGQLGVLVTVFILTKSVPGNLNTLVLALTAVPVCVLILASIYLYRKRLIAIAPALKEIDFRYARSIFNTGGAFFIIQIGALILFQTDNIIITKFVGPASVTDFNVAYKLFATIIMGFTILMTPYWSAFTDAYAKNDFAWMRSSMQKMKKVWLLIVLLLIPALTLCAEWIYKIWVKDAVHIDRSLTLSIALYTITYTGMSLNSYFLNGVGKIKIQQYLYIAGCCINIPLGIAMAKQWGASGAVMANVVVLSVMMFILWIQSNKILKGSARGLWNR